MSSVFASFFLLQQGVDYAWQVQKMADGVVLNKTEAWIFHIRPIRQLESLKYVVPKRQLDGSFCTAYDGLAYFKFSEEYKAQGKLDFQLFDAKSRLVPVEIKSDSEKKHDSASLKTTGDNLYELNMNVKKLESGFYTLEIKNEKKETFYLKVFLP